MDDNKTKQRHSSFMAVTARGHTQLCVPTNRERVASLYLTLARPVVLYLTPMPSTKKTGLYFSWTHVKRTIILLWMSFCKTTRNFCSLAFSRMVEKQLAICFGIWSNCLFFYGLDWRPCRKVAILNGAKGFQSRPGVRALRRRLKEMKQPTLTETFQPKVALQID